VFTETAPTSAQDIKELRLDGTGAVRPLVATPATERNAEGRWLAFEADVSGRYDIYVRPFPDVARGQWHVSIDGDGGTRPLWSRDSRELFYLSLTGALMRVGVAPGPT
jgi:serine/threonine-protein kinase